MEITRLQFLSIEKKYFSSYTLTVNVPTTARSRRFYKYNCKGNGNGIGIHLASDEVRGEDSRIPLYLYVY